MILSAATAAAAAAAAAAATSARTVDNIDIVELMQNPIMKPILLILSISFLLVGISSLINMLRGVIWQK